MILFTSTITFTLLTATTLATPFLSPRQATNGPHSSPPTIIWSCMGNTSPSLNIPSVCANMCYGAYCRGYGTSLTWDDFAGNTFANRKYNAGCVGATWDYGIEEGGLGGWWDRCKEYTRMACSVYPFLSTAESDVDAPGGDWGPVSRCVDAGEDARQNIMLYSLYASLGPFTNNQGLNATAPSRFSQIFANAGEIEYCSVFAAAKNHCVADGWEADRNGQIIGFDPLDTVTAATASSTSSAKVRQQQQQQKQPQHKTYRLKNNNLTITITTSATSSHNLNPGDKVLIPTLQDDDKFKRQSEAHVFDVTKGLEQYAYISDGNLWFEDYEIEGVD